MLPLNYFLFLQINLISKLNITPETARIRAILVTSLATFLSRFLGVISSQGIKETSKLFRWFNCLAYSTLAALIARTIIFPVGVLSDASY